MRLGICAGHSVISPGVVVAGETEQAWCRRIADGVAFEASRRGWEVIDPRSDEMGLGYPEYLVHRIEALRRAQVDAAIDVHLNATRDRTINHSLVIYGEDDPEGDALAQAISDELARGLPWPSRGAVADGQLGRRLAFVRRLPCPAVIVEALFLSNADARSWLRKSGSVASLAGMIARGAYGWSVIAAVRTVASEVVRDESG
jgi:N-acetylmuramoyl-L-alanine amidase